MATEYFDEYDNLDGYEIPWPIIKFNLNPPKYKIDIKNHYGEGMSERAYKNAECSMYKFLNN